MDNYTILNMSQWHTSLCVCDSESCFLSCIVPCHVYAKIKSTTKSLYCVYLFGYICVYLSIHQLLYSQHYIIENTCPLNMVSTCLVDDKCKNTYIIIDDIKYACIEQNGFCVSNEHSCIEQPDSKHISINLLIFTSIAYFVLVFMHYSAREHIKKQQNIDESFIENIAAVVCCPNCGLAQEYREL